MILVNGVTSDAIAVTDRGLAYGDGVFRTFAVRGGEPLQWQRHYDRLNRDCATLGIACPDEATLRADLAHLSRSGSDFAVKIIITRGPGARGYAPPSPAHPTRIVSASALPHYPQDFASRGIRLRLCALRLGFQPALAGIKHLNRLENVLARREWNDADIAEGLLCDTEGNAICGTMTNLFLVERGALFTPALTRCGVAGVTRDRVIDAAARHGVACHVENISYERVMRAGEVWLTNSLVGVWQAWELGDRRWAPGTLVAHMRQWLDEEGA
ncbi:MAG: aminodeoxychorismate lyase [Burkholderiales bacterium]|nr:aminodeoxychorismate lyase [Burkholderiales bacterium]